MNTVPNAVSGYLKSLSIARRSFGYLKLNDSHHVIASGGALQQFSLPLIDATKPIENQIDLLSGVLPVSGAPVVIINAVTNLPVYIDMHIFIDEGFQWVVFLNNTEAGEKLQAEQQTRLSEDLRNESSNKAD